MLSNLVGILTHAPVIEKDAVLKMQGAGVFPSKKYFSSALAQDCDSPFGAEDLAKIVNKILQRAIPVSEAYGSVTYIADNFSCQPEYSGVALSRKEEVYRTLEHIAVAYGLADKLLGSIHYCKAKIDSFSQVNIDVVVECAEPDMGLSFPVKVSKTVDVFATFNSYSEFVDSIFFWHNAVSLDDMKFAMYLGAKAVIASSGSFRELDWDDFVLTGSFLNDLKSHQCMPTDKFGGTLFDLMKNIIANSLNCKINEYRESESSPKQLERMGLRAYRAHVTEGGLALRLMFWRAENKTIFTNVKNKFELKIDFPC